MAMSADRIAAACAQAFRSQGLIATDEQQETCEANMRIVAEAFLAEITANAELRAQADGEGNVTGGIQ